jgi:hypothetical protein
LVEWQFRWSVRPASWSEVEGKRFFVVVAKCC